jgi:hypothetical protein
MGCRGHGQGAAAVADDKLLVLELVFRRGGRVQAVATEMMRLVCSKGSSLSVLETYGYVLL